MIVNRPEAFDGSAPVLPHPGRDRIRAGDSPFGTTVVVYRRLPAAQVLLLHRAHEGPDYEGDWAWTPPAGARFPAEPPDDCAARELSEETGIEAQPTRLSDCGSTEWWVYALEVGGEVAVMLDEEHDRFEWLSPVQALARCRPAEVSDSLKRLCTCLGLRV